MVHRAFIQTQTWANSGIVIIPVTAQIEFGWKLQGNAYFPETTDDDIAPYCIINPIMWVQMQLCCICLMNGLVYRFLWLW